MSMPTDCLPSDDLRNIVHAAAAPLRPSDVESFLTEVGEELRRYSEIGPGLVFHTVREVQRRYFEPPVQPYRGPRHGR